MLQKLPKALLSPPDLRRPLSTSPPQVAAPRSGPFRAPALPGRPGPLQLVLPRCLSWEETGRGSWPWLHSGVSNTRAALAGHSCLSAGSLSLSPRLAGFPSRVVPALRGVPTVRCEASLSGRASESADEGPSPSPTGRAPPALGFHPLPASPPLTASPPRGSFLWSPTIAVPTGPSSPWSLSSRFLGPSPSGRCRSRPSLRQQTYVPVTLQQPRLSRASRREPMLLPPAAAAARLPCSVSCHPVAGSPRSRDVS